MNFLIQGNNGIPSYDFCYELIKSIEHQSDYVRYYKVVNDIRVNSYYGFNKLCPVGSVEFVYQYFNNHNIPIPKPLNIPDELKTLSGLRPRIIGCNKPVYVNSSNGVFIKNTEEVKHPLNGHVDVIPPGNWQVTDYIEHGFYSEWRCFVHRGKLLDCKIYSGDIYDTPDYGYIISAIDAFKDSPISYTLDVGVLDSGTCIIECHNFYSCGLYGFSDRNRLPQMFAQWYSEYLKNAKR